MYNMSTRRKFNKHKKFNNISNKQKALCDVCEFPFYKTTPIVLDSFDSIPEFDIAGVLQNILKDKQLSRIPIYHNFFVTLPSGEQVKIDLVLVIGNKTVWIEYGGYQHIGLVPDLYPEDADAVAAGLTSNQRLRNQKYRDDEVRKYAKAHDISLIVYQTESPDKWATKAFNNDYLSYRSVKTDLEQALDKLCFIYNNNVTTY